MEYRQASVVAKEAPDQTIVAGNPARVICNGIKMSDIKMRKLTQRICTNAKCKILSK